MGDPGDLAERGAQLRVVIVVQPGLGRRQDRFLVVVAHADHERQVEALVVGGVRAREAPRTPPG